MKSKSIAKNAFFKLLLNLFNVIVPIIIGPYVARKLGSDLLGTINFAQSINGYFYIFASFGIYNYGLREISRKRENEKEIRQTFTSLFIFTIITNTLIGIIYIVFINTRYGGQDVATAAMILSGIFLFNIFYTEWVNEGLENYDFISIKTICVRIVYLILLFIMVRGAKDWKSYVFLLVFSIAANNLLSFIYIKRRIKFDFSNIELKKHIKPMFFVVILSNANILYTQLDKIMLGEYVNKSSVSYYVMAQNVITIVNSIALTIITVSLPRLSNYLSNNEENQYIYLVNKLAKYLFYFLFPMSMGIAVLGKEIMLFYGGNDYIEAGSVLIVFGIYMITMGYEYILSNQVLYLKKKEKIQVRLLFTGGVINLVLNYSLVKLGWFNAENSVITTMISTCIFFVMEYIYIKNIMKLKINLFGFDKLKYLLISLVFIPITMLIRNFISNYILVIIVGILVNIIYYFGILLISKDKLTFEIIAIAKGKAISIMKKFK